MVDVKAVALGHIFKWEGGRSDHPKDPGGLTVFGISIKFAGSIHLDLDRDGKTTRADVEMVTPEIATAIYDEHFWRKAMCHRLPPPLAFAQMDAAVNLGVSRAIRLLQKGLNASLAGRLATDGNYGPMTDAAVSRLVGDNTGNLLRIALAETIARRGEWYCDLRKPDFTLGWMRRLTDCTLTAESIREGTLS